MSDGGDGGAGAGGHSRADRDAARRPVAPDSAHDGQKGQAAQAKGCSGGTVVGRVCEVLVNGDEQEDVTEDDGKVVDVHGVV